MKDDAHREPPSADSDARSPQASADRGLARGLLIAAVVGLAAWGLYGWSQGRWSQGNLPESPNDPAAADSGSPTADGAPSGGAVIGEVSWDEVDDPSRDGWPTEDFARRAGEQLDRIAKLLKRAKPVKVDKVASLTDERFRCDPLLPPQRTTVLEDDLLHVQRFRRDATQTPDGEPEPPYSGAAGLAAALNDLLATFPAAQKLKCKFKVFRVELGEDEVTTTQYVACSAKTERGLVEQNATWVIRWTRPDGEEPPRLREVVVDDFEMTHLPEQSDHLFSDCTEAVLAANPCFQDQLLRGLNHWLERSQQRRLFLRLGTPGIAVADVNGDGLEDIYLCQENGLPNKLFLHQADGTAVEMSGEWGVDWIYDCRSALLIDWDNDGDQDLAVAFLGGVILATNEQQQKFVVREVVSTNDDVMSLAAADYDADGDLDIFVCSYYSGAGLGPEQVRVSGIPASGADFVFHDANNGGPNSLLRNDGEHGFTDVTAEVGLDQNNSRFSLAAAWEDYDNDGDQDLYVANDYGRDNLYRNEGGKFVDVAEVARVENAATGMGVTWADYNRDGWMDVHVSNMWSSAGNRIAFQPEFKASASPAMKRRVQRMARGNTLLQGRPDGVFVDTSSKAAIEVGRWAWSSNFVDINNDGWEDLIVANGFITGEDPADL